MVCSHRCSAEEGTLLPETAEEVWNEPQNPQILLHLHCGEHPVICSVISNILLIIKLRLVNVIRPSLSLGA